MPQIKTLKQFEERYYDTLPETVSAISGADRHRNAYLIAPVVAQMLTHHGFKDIDIHPGYMIAEDEEGLGAFCMPHVIVSVGGEQIDWSWTCKEDYPDIRNQSAEPYFVEMQQAHQEFNIQDGLAESMLQGVKDALLFHNEHRTAIYTSIEMAANGGRVCVFKGKVSEHQEEEKENDE